MDGWYTNVVWIKTSINDVKKDVSYNENDELQTQNKYMKQRWMVWEEGWIWKERWERIKGQICELYRCGRNKNG